MTFWKAKSKELSPHDRANREWGLVAARADQEWETLPEFVSASTLVPPSRPFLSWKEAIAATRTNLVANWPSQTKRLAALHQFRRLAAEVRRPLLSQRWPISLLEHAESFKVHDLPLAPSVTPFAGDVVLLLTADLLVSLCLMHRSPGDSLAVSDYDDSRMRIDLWTPWRENAQQVDQRYSYVTFEVAVRGAYLSVVQHCGTLWFQQPLFSQFGHLLDGSRGEDPLTPFMRVDLVNRYRTHFEYIHKLYTGNAPRPVPPARTFWSDQDDGGWTQHRTVLLDNEERAARFNLRYCQSLDSLVHFDLKSLRLGEGSELATLFRTSRTTAGNVINQWLQFGNDQHLRESP